MKLSLYITKNYNIKDYRKPSHIKIAVIDKDISKHYPKNFVCVLPRTFNPNSKNPNLFQQKYGEQSKEIILKLLNKALKKEEDPHVKEELQKRLKLLKPKPKTIVKCRFCGKDFEAKKYYYGRQTICQECKTTKKQW